VPKALITFAAGKIIALAKQVHNIWQCQIYNFSPILPFLHTIIVTVKNRQNDKRKNEKMDKDQNGMPIYPEQEGCAAHPELAEGVQLAMVYAPKQAFRMLYTAPDALKHGTLFEELYKPLEEV
jgi:hypothetical protein